jgi:thymidylate synthase
MNESINSMQVSAESLGECWIACIDNVLRYGISHMDEDVPIRESLGLSMHISNPKCQDPLIDAVGDRAVVERMLAKFTKGVEMPERPFTYGSRIFDNSGVNQFEWMIQRLMSKRETKSATIGLLIPGSEAANLPCLTTIDAKIRHDKLDLHFFFRSQNIFGRQYANLLALSRLQKDVAVACGIGIGALRGYVSSAHIYEFDLTQAHRIVAGERFTICDRYYQAGPQSIRVSAAVAS